MSMFIQREPLPVTILTGFLGSGKTTLLERVLREAHGQKLAVIENELGEVGIDNEILVESAAEEIVVMRNGCICCTVRGDLSRILVDLARKRAAGTLDFSRVVIETTGVANPAPVIQTFSMDKEVRARYRLDGLITLVDAKHAHAQLDRNSEAQEQVAFADRLLLSKTDLVSEGEERELRRRLARMNPRARIERVNFGAVSLENIFDINGFHLDARLELSADYAAVMAPTVTAPKQPDESTEHGCSDHGCSDHGCSDHGCTEHAHHAADAGAPLHDDAIQSFVLRTEVPVDVKRFQAFILALVDKYSADMMRYKGILHFLGTPERFIFQGVHMVMSATPGKEWARHEKRESLLVFIGRNLPQPIFEREFARCLVRDNPQLDMPLEAP
jgi:G3E family GTPase